MEGWSTDHSLAKFVVHVWLARVNQGNMWLGGTEAASAMQKI
jgi:hypothetical protein